MSLKCWMKIACNVLTADTRAVYWIWPQSLPREDSCSEMSREKEK